MSDIKRYIVTGRHTGGSVTYNCPTPEWALKKVRDFLHSEYTKIVCTGPDGAMLSETDLVALIAGGAAGGAPVDIGAPSAPRMLALA